MEAPPCCYSPLMPVPDWDAYLEQLRSRVAFQSLEFTGHFGRGKTCDMEGILVVGHLDAAPRANRLNLPHCRIWEAEVNRGPLALQDLLNSAA